MLSAFAVRTCIRLQFASTRFGLIFRFEFGFGFGFGFEFEIGFWFSDLGTPHNQLVELKNGETFNGHLVNCDNFMNITLREVYQTNADGDVFWKLKECYIRGSTVRGWRL